MWIMFMNFRARKSQVQVSAVEFVSFATWGSLFSLSKPWAVDPEQISPVHGIWGGLK